MCLKGRLRGLAPGDLAGQVGPGDHGDSPGRHAGHLGDHLAHPLAGALLDALHQADQQRIARKEVDPREQVLAQGLGRDGQDDETSAVQCLGGVMGREQ